MEVMADRAVSLGLKKLCFTDHMDIDYPKTADDYSFIFHLEDYLKKLEELKAKYKDRLDLLIGVELGLQPEISDKLKAFTSSYPFDFIIGSSHVVDHIDPYYSTFWNDISEEEGVMKYFQSIIDNSKVCDDFHVYGHLDYIVRYTPTMTEYRKIISSQNNDIQNDTSLKSPKPKCPEYSYDKYADIIDEVLRTLLSYGKGIEINTSGLKYGLDHTHPRKEILKRYRDLGGEIITIGSDAHKPEHLAYRFGEAADLLKSLGFRYYAIYEQGKPNMMKL